MSVQHAETLHPVQDLQQGKLDYNALIGGALQAAPGIISAFNNNHPSTPNQPPPGYYVVPPANQQQHASIAGSPLIWVAVAVMVVLVFVILLK